MIIRGRGFMRRVPLVEATEDGVVLEGADKVAWDELADLGPFTNELASGLGLRLVDPERWFAGRKARRFTVIGSVAGLERRSLGLADLLGARGPQVPSDLDRRIEWARGVTGGWDLTIAESELGIPAVEAAGMLRDYRRRIAPE